ncbi:hypothetical protein [Haloactinomyces albus]|uniref:Uncharacterized protein n=1 Tax=Haloactinomyces albus TaxID=1352928 RepID=A0AAE3ZIY6_9ACTN|nr:hypothetical protein [Haloactinomyces albus]MDR7304463.1 hypothetical protein [Haloactinomyces albus]
MHPSTHPRPDRTRADRRTPAPRRELRAPRPVAAVTFLEPTLARSNPDPRPRRADRSHDTMRRLRTPFTADEASHR